MKNICSGLPDELVKKIIFDNVNEITLRANKNVIVKADNIYYKIDYVMRQKDVEETLKKFCNLSVYAYLDEIKNGFVTIDGGHRVGICGTVVLKDNNIYNVKNISSVNIRIANEIKGCSDKLDFNIKNLLIISPPCCGKTTIIRDLCRRLGCKNKISVVDERGEIAGMNNGVSCFDIGIMTDVLSLVPKSKGIEYVLRSMSPEYIVTDEIASSDCEALYQALTYGVKIIATAHGNNINETLKRLKILKNQFQNIVLLSNKNGIGTVEEVIFND